MTPPPNATATPTPIYTPQPTYTPNPTYTPVPRITPTDAPLQGGLVLEKSAVTGRLVNVKPGDLITYTLIVRNTGDTPLNKVVVRDPLMNNIVSYIEGSAIPNVSRIEASTLIWEIGTLAPRSSTNIQFAVRVASQIGSQVQVSNVANAQDETGQQTNSTIKSNRVDFPLDPSAVTLASFTAQRRDKDVRIRWVTLSEIDTWSFAIYRANGRHSAHEPPTNAVKITAQNILAEGRGGAGATYEVIDSTAAPQQTYTYWLVEMETSGNQNTYGPAQWLGASRIYLPIALRK